jgi:predicted ATPase
VGINTGEVVLRSVRKDDLHTDYVPVGDSTNLAARMESPATPGSIVVSGATYRLIEGDFACKPLGAAQAKGINQPVNVYEVLGIGPLRTRLQVAARQGLARFVGRQVVAEALAIVDKTGEHWYEAELHRLKGQLTLQQSSVQSLGSSGQNPQSPIPNPQSDAEACFLKAIEVARQQQAKSLELRATISLARLWQSQGKKTEAHKLLSAVYNWFTEGFDTKDLQDAKALWDELSLS